MRPNLGHRRSELGRADRLPGYWPVRTLTASKPAKQSGDRDLLFTSRAPTALTQLC